MHNSICGKCKNNEITPWSPPWDDICISLCSRCTYIWWSSDARHKIFKAIPDENIELRAKILICG